MPVDSKHPEYQARELQWQRCRDCTEGEDAIKARTTDYLPRLSGQEKDFASYNKYLQRAYFYGATGRTVQGICGAVFRKALTVQAPRGAGDLLADPTRTGATLDDLARTLFLETIATGRVGLQVSMSSQASPVPAPYLVPIPTEDLINWQLLLMDRQELVLAVIRETYWEQEDLYQVKKQPRYRYRVLALGATSQGRQRYGVTVWEKRKTEQGQDEWQIVQGPFYPQRRGAFLEFIPLLAISPHGLRISPQKPPVLDLAYANLDHYRLMADYRHGLHYCGIPTPTAAGVPAQTELRIGAETAWVAENPEARFAMLEFTGQGLNPLKEAIEGVVDYMASLGARLLEQPKKAVEAADTHRIRQSGEESVVAAIAGSVGQGLSQALTWAYQWATASQDQITVSLNKDLLDSELTGPMLDALVRSWQAGAFAYETLHYNLQRGELARPGVDVEEEKQLIALQAPASVEPVDA